MAARDSDLLVDLLRSAGLIRVTKVVRQFRGRWQASAGAWAWVALDENDGIVGGSEDTMRECVRCGVQLGRNSSGSVPVYAMERKP